VCTLHHFMHAQTRQGTDATLQTGWLPPWPKLSPLNTTEPYKYHSGRDTGSLDPLPSVNPPAVAWPPATKPPQVEKGATETHGIARASGPRPTLHGIAGQCVAVPCTGVLPAIRMGSRSDAARERVGGLQAKTVTAMFAEGQVTAHKQVWPSISCHRLDRPCARLSTVYGTVGSLHNEGHSQCRRTACSTAVGCQWYGMPSCLGPIAQSDVGSLPTRLYGAVPGCSCPP
jgi:hypothetical protein